MHIINRPLTTQEAQLLYRLIKETPNITGYSISELLHFTNVSIAEENGNIMGVCITKDLFKEWSEIALLFVLDKYRRQGVGNELFGIALKSIIQRKRNVYVVSRKPSVIRWMSDNKMTMVDKIYKLPVQINLYNAFYILNLYRISEYFRKDFKKELPNWIYGYKYADSSFKKV